MSDTSQNPALDIRGLNVFYGASHALQGVELVLPKGVMSVVGRNGMGKTTLCKAIMGLCWWDPTDSIRSLADDAACRYADVHGDHVFKKAVDGTAFVAVTEWFYGTLPKPVQARRLDRTKQFDVQQLLLLAQTNVNSEIEFYIN